MKNIHLCAILAIFLLSACSGAVAPTQAPLPTSTPFPATQTPSATDTQTPAPTSVPTATPLPTVTAAPTIAPPTGQTVTYQGVSFVLPSGVASGISGKIVPEVKDDGNSPAFAIHPQYTEITLNGYSSQNKYHQPRLEIYPVAGLLLENSLYVTGTVLGLQSLVQQHTPLASLAGQYPGQPLPFLPVFNAAQILHVKGQYVSFLNGSGIRYVTQFDQAFLPINNQEVIYTFQGLTSDGKYYVVAVLPVAAPVLAPTDDYKATGAGFVPFPADQVDAQAVEKYHQAVIDKLDALPDEQYSPSLALLDSIVKTLRVQ